MNKDQNNTYLHQVFQATRDAVIVTDQNGNITATNPGFTKLFGHTQASVHGKHLEFLCSPCTKPGLFTDALNASSTQKVWEERIWVQHASGELRLVWCRIEQTENSPKAPPAQRSKPTFILIITDITELDQSQRQLDHISHHDILTGLPNRLFLIEQLNQKLASSRAGSAGFAVFFLDLDNFKHINDSLGHDVGDELLKDIAQQIFGQDNPDFVARLGGDEFVVIPERGKHADYSDVAARYIKGFGTAFEVQGHTLYTTISLGISVYPNDTTKAEELVRFADIAMFKAKVKGKNRYEYFKPYMAHVANKRQQIELKFRQALEAGSIDIFFQPQFDLQNNRACGVEVLVRWHEPELGGWVGPSEFIPIVENMGLIQDLSDLVLTKLCQQMRCWLDQGIDIPLVSINVSSFQIDHPQFLEHFLKILKTHRIAPPLFELEFTESVLMLGWKKVNATLQRLRDLGVKVAIDDFGTGYSSLSYLAKMSVQRIKIDQMFIRNIHNSSNDAVLVRMVIALGNALGISIIAEGVETPEQLEFLKNAGCTQTQGFYHAKALPAVEFEALLKAQSLRNSVTC